MIGYVILGIVAVVALWGVLIYNRFISLDRKRQEGWSGISVQLKRRHDLIPNLINAVKGYAAHEKSALEQVTSMRGLKPNASVGEVAASENMLTQALGRLFAVAEAYPDLKASANFLSLQAALQEVETEIQMARRYFNGTVRDFNTLVASFPSMIVARMCSFTEKEFFELDDPGEAAVPQVEF